MTIALPAVLIFGAVTLLLLRSRTVRALEAVIIALFGFFLATTGLGHEITLMIDNLFGLHSAPSQPPKGGLQL